MIERARLDACMALLREAEAPVRVPRHLAWPRTVHEHYAEVAGRAALCPECRMT